MELVNYLDAGNSQGVKIDVALAGLVQVGQALVVQLEPDGGGPGDLDRSLGDAQVGLPAGEEEVFPPVVRKAHDVDVGDDGVRHVRTPVLQHRPPGGAQAVGVHLLRGQALFLDTVFQVVFWPYHSTSQCQRCNHF